MQKVKWRKTLWLFMNISILCLQCAPQNLCVTFKKNVELNENYATKQSFLSHSHFKWSLCLSKAKFPCYGTEKFLSFFLYFFSSPHNLFKWRCLKVDNTKNFREIKEGHLKFIKAKSTSKFVFFLSSWKLFRRISNRNFLYISYF